MELVNFIVCDDIRPEMRRKHTLVGVYGDSIVIGRIGGSGMEKEPLRLNLAFYVSLRRKPEEKTPDGFTLAFMQGEKVEPKITGRFNRAEELAKSNRVNLNVSVGGFPFYQEGRVRWKLDLTLGEEVLQSLEGDAFGVQFGRAEGAGA